MFRSLDKLANGKYKYRIYRHFPPSLTSFGTLITSDTQSKNSKYYGFFYGIVTDNNLNKFSVTIGENTFAEVVEKNKFFIKVYDMGNFRSMGLTRIKDKQ